MSDRMSVITDWRVHDDDLPDVPPGEEFECVFTPQKHVVLCRIVVRGLCLIRLQTGPVEIPFELDSAKERHVRHGVRTYQLTRGFAVRYVPAATVVTIPEGSATADLGCVPVYRTADGEGEIPLVPGLAVRVLLRNETNAPAKPRAALLVREENI